MQTKHTVFALINPEPNCEKEVEETVMAVRVSIAGTCSRAKPYSSM